jgi:hypothetical protein
MIKELQVINSHRLVRNDFNSMERSLFQNSYDKNSNSLQVLSNFNIQKRKSKSSESSISHSSSESLESENNVR